MLEAWSSIILQACHEAGVVTLADALELAACLPEFVAWFATSELTLSKLAQELGWRWIVGSTIDIVLIGRLLLAHPFLQALRRWLTKCRCQMCRGHWLHQLPSSGML
jgi:hypothetical protein